MRWRLRPSGTRRLHRADVEARARRLFERSLGHGVTRIRTHTDVDPIVELRSMQGVLAAKQQMAGRIDVDIVAFSTSRNDLAEPEAPPGSSAPSPWAPT